MRYIFFGYVLISLNIRLKKLSKISSLPTYIFVNSTTFGTLSTLISEESFVICDTVYKLLQMLFLNMECDARYYITWVVSIRKNI